MQEIHFLLICMLVRLVLGITNSSFTSPDTIVFNEEYVLVSVSTAILSSSAFVYYTCFFA